MNWQACDLGMALSRPALPTSNPSLLPLPFPFPFPISQDFLVTEPGSHVTMLTMYSSSPPPPHLPGTYWGGGGDIEGECLLQGDGDRYRSVPICIYLGDSSDRPPILGKRWQLSRNDADYLAICLPACLPAYPCTYNKQGTCQGG